MAKKHLRLAVLLCVVPGLLCVLMPLTAVQAGEVFGPTVEFDVTGGDGGDSIDYEVNPSGTEITGRGSVTVGENSELKAANTIRVGSPTGSGVLAGKGYIYASDVSVQDITVNSGTWVDNAVAPDPEPTPDPSSVLTSFVDATNSFLGSATANRIPEQS